MPIDDRMKQKLAEAFGAMARIRRGELPSAEELAVAPKLEFWSVGNDGMGLVLYGIVTNHPKFEDGTQIQTSELLWLSDDRCTARTLSRFYRLGVRFDEALGRSS